MRWSTLDEEGDRFGLDDDRVHLGHRRAGLQRNGDGSGQGQGQVDDGVVGAGEAERRDAVTGVHGVADQGVGQSADAVPGLAVGDGVEARLVLGDGAAGGVLDELDGALAEGGPVGVAGHDGADGVGEQDVRPADGCGDCSIRLGGNELRVARGQRFEAALESSFACVGWS